LTASIAVFDWELYKYLTMPLSGLNPRTNVIKEFNHRTYTEFWAWFPTRTTAGELVWLTHYYITPTRHGYGRTLSKHDLILESVRYFD